MIFKIVYSEIDSPDDISSATSLDGSTGVRAVNCSKAPAQVTVSSSDNLQTITLCPQESIVLKKSHEEKVHSSTNLIRIAGVSIY
jgi:hypothetical protein